jgi:GntR family transcriptional regulator, transcriptional repressor for pyruvate dehydrogenase complex
MFGSPDSITKTSVSRQIADDIRAALMGGRLKGDDRLPTEEELSARYGVSRPTIREALKLLAAQNLIRSRRGPAGGTFISKLDVGDLAGNVTSAAMMLVSVGQLEMEELTQARIALESLCCSLAVERAESASLSLAAVLERQKDSRLSDEEFCASDVAFHRAIADATENRMLRLVMYAVIEAVVPITNMVIVGVRQRSAIIAYHESMLEALTKRDTKAMTATLADLIGYISDRYSEAKLQRSRREAISTVDRN